MFLNYYPDKTLVIVGGGPSVTQNDLRLIHKTKVHSLAINKGALDMHSSPTYTFSADPFWMSKNANRVEVLGSTVIYAVPKVMKPQNLHRRNIDINHIKLERTNIPEMIYPKPNRLPTKLGYDGNSGFSALNLGVVLYGTVILLGFDMYSGHWHGGYRHSLAERVPILYALWAERINGIAEQTRGTRVVNCSEHSTITAFPKMSFQEAMEKYGT